jgi:hypothetical protein
MRRRKSLIQSREKDQEVGFFGRIVLIRKATAIDTAKKLRESHANARNKSKEVATVSPQPPDL